MIQIGPVRAALGAIAVAGACGYALPSAAASKHLPVATPAGITLQPLGTGQGYGMEALLTELPRTQIAFADAKGMTLYTFDQDAPGKSRCAAACAKTWIPAAAPRFAKPVGDWAIFARGDGSKQWEYQGKPVYTYVHDTDIGSVWGIDPKQLRQDVGYQVHAAGPAKQHPPGWHPALFFPMTGVVMPSDIAIREIEDAGGLAFVDGHGMTLYAYEGRGGAKALVAVANQATQWKPLVAPELVHGVGQWSILSRSDGIRQWAFRGKPLYTFEGDLWPGDANGVGWDKRWNPVLAVSVYLPSDVHFEQTLGRGKVLATATGLTLYRRDGVALDTGGGQSLRHSIPIRPGIGRNIGVKGCEGTCLQSWHPFIAPANARPDGFWDVAIRPDGTRQWVYQGYPLYTYAGDQKPGDMNGNDTFDFLVSGSPNQVNDVGTPMHGTAGLYWTVTYP
jgi:predicted lipoprotein with Yx(FWY)xxD motif